MSGQSWWTNPRAGAHRDHLVLSEQAVAYEYDVVGERDGRWVQVSQAITSVEEVRTTIADYRFGSPSVTWHVIARTTTITETLANDVLDPIPTTEGTEQ